MEELELKIQQRCEYCFGDDHVKEECNGLRNLIILYMEQRILCKFELRQSVLNGALIEIPHWYEYDSFNDFLKQSLGCSRAAMRFANKQQVHKNPLRKYEQYEKILAYLKYSGITPNQLIEMYQAAKIG
jgi:hypothetical protein